MLTGAARKSIAAAQIVLDSDNGDIGAPPDMSDSSNDYTDQSMAPSQPLPFARQQSSGTFSTAVLFPVPTLEVESRPRGAELSPPPSFTDFRDLEDSTPSTTRPPRPPGVAPSGQQKYTILRHKACL